MARYQDYESRKRIQTKQSSQFKEKFEWFCVGMFIGLVFTLWFLFYGINYVWYWFH